MASSVTEPTRPFTSDERGAVHLHAVVANELYGRIKSLHPHAALPSERQLAEEFNVSRTTARQALDRLAASGLVYRIRGSGTFVSEGGIIAKRLGITSFSEDMIARGLTPSSAVIDVSVHTASEDISIATDLNLRLADQTVLLRRVRQANSTPMAYECVVLPYHLVPGIDTADLTGSLYAILERRYQLRVSRMQQRVRAVVLSPLEANYLGCSPGEPALRFVRLGYDLRGIPLERAVTLYRGDRYEFSMGAQLADE